MTFTHFILTRFNLGIYNEGNPYHIQDPEAWMNHRLNLFDRYTLPGIMEQSCQNFTWVLAFDQATPRDIISRYDYLDNVQICYTQPHTWLRSLPASSDFLLTTRLDNDDFLLPEFVEKVQSRFDSIEKIVDVHYTAYSIFHDAYYESGRTRPNSPFLSLYEKWGLNPVTALGHPHTDMPNYYPAEWLDDSLAVQVIHTRNVCNKINGNRL